MPEILDSIDWGTSVSSTSVTVYFAGLGETFGGITSDGWTAYEISRAMAALNEFASVSNLTFSRTFDSGTATFKLVTATSAEVGALGWFNPPGEADAGVGAFAWDAPSWDFDGSTGGLEEGALGYYTLIHEFGHGLGLAHPHDEGGSSVIMEGVTDSQSHGDFYLNQGVFTAMSYNWGWERNPTGASPSDFYGLSGSLGALDIAIIQSKYGAKSSNTGDNIYNLPTANTFGTFYETIYDTGGSDTIVNPGSADSTISLVAATIDYSATGGGGISYLTGVQGGFTIAQNVVIENATGGSGNDILIGNSAGNVLDGGLGTDTVSYRHATAAVTVSLDTTAAQDTLGAGTDTLLNFENLTGSASADDLTGSSGVNILDGGAGADEMAGLGGHDTYLVDDSLDVVVETAVEGIDVVQTSLSAYQLGANVEYLIYAGTPTADFAGIGNELPNYLQGWNGDDTLDGGAGPDSMAGLAGNDTYKVDSDDDLLDEGVDAGTDTILTVLALYELNPNIERLIYEGAQTADFHGTGNELDNYLEGWDGDDTLDGAGGADEMVGLGGDDLYAVDHADDEVVEEVGAGTDKVYSLLTAYTLGANVEKLEFFGNSTDDFTGTGNAVANTISGWDGDDTLDGAGGADMMIGDAGDDTYKVDDTDDITWEEESAGTDTVETALTAYILDPHIERLVYTGSPTEDLWFIGNAQDNVLTGASGDDQLDGAGGADEMEGLGGDDSYAVDDSLDEVIEAFGAGFDSVFTTLAAYTLTANVDLLMYQGPENEDFAGTGNELGNAIQGGDGDDTLDGAGGVDQLTGLLGDDTYYLDQGGDTVVEQASEGTDTVYVATMFYTLGANVENLIFNGGQFTDFKGTGNELANLIQGRDGDDILVGGTGADELRGLAGDDVYEVDNVLDSVVEAANAGTDIVETTLAAYTLTSNVEQLVFAGAATVAFQGTGNGLANVIRGGSVDDTLDGAGGADELTGYLGDDSYFLDQVGETVIEAADAGTDTVNVAITVYALGANLENLVYDGVGGDFTGTGNGLSNEITGATGNDALDGAGGADEMQGGLGDDTYKVDDAGDVVIEHASAGTDRVDTILQTYALTANVENLVYAGLTGSFTGTGNALANAIAGGASGDLLDGGAGADTLTGGAGNDTYLLDSAADAIVETAITGSTADVAKSSVSYTLGAGVRVESLMTASAVGTNAINLTGNEFTNTVTGNAGANQLKGMAANDSLTGDAGNDELDGGSGDDALNGGAGNDTYLIDSAADAIVETLTTGSTADVARTSVSYTLGAGVRVESLMTTALAGTGAINLTGNEFANAITGNAGVNALKGMAGNDTIVGDAGNDSLDGGAGDDSLNGGAGNDSYTVDSAADAIVETAITGSTADVAKSSVSYTLGAGVRVESLMTTSLAGTGAINLTGNEFANTVTGNAGANVLKGMAGNDSLVGDAGNDSLDGGAGNDNLNGGAGNDSYTIDSATDIIVETLTTGSTADVAKSSVSYTLGVGVRVESLMTTSLAGTALINLTGNEFANTITGNAAANTLKGMGGNDSLVGDAGNDSLDGGAGTDTLNGGAGNDTYTLDSAADVIVETLTTGSAADVARSSVSYTLGAAVRVESLMTTSLTGTALINLTGNELANAITGNAGANLLKGMGGNDSLVGDAGNDSLDGGAGTDTLNGGAGNDIYTLDSAADIIVETLTTGSTADVARSSVSYTLGAAVRVESLMTTSLAGTALINLTGNELANAITGNAGANLLKGMGGNDSLVGDAGNDSLDGGTGNDTLNGGAGNDIYVVDNAADRIVETATSASTDTVRASVSYILGAGVRVENLATTNAAGTGAINLTGNEFGNSLTGNAAANVLDGGSGADRLAGNAGDDTYVVDNVADEVIEAASLDRDTVRSSATTFTLAANIEKLILTGTGAINGTGNATYNELEGNVAANTLNGADGDDRLSGGDGNDVLNGGNGEDRQSGQLGDDALNGGAGVDFLSGGDGNDVLNGGSGIDDMWGDAGNDIYFVDSPQDGIAEFEAGGSDEVRTGLANYILEANWVERLTGTSAAGQILYGNELNNIVTGHTGADRLNGGDGQDILRGGQGNDTYLLVGESGMSGLPTDDIVVEGLGAGIDTVELLASGYVLADNVENAVIIGGYDVTGNALGNALTGNAEANRLDGAGGADTMRGGGGDDVYIVDTYSSSAATADDLVIEAAGGGFDEVRSSVSYVLPSQVEILYLTGSKGLSGIGNGLDNYIEGTAAADKLFGKAGNDLIKAGAGADGFYFDTALSSTTNVDYLTAFAPAEDSIFLDRTTFTNAGAAGTLAAAAFHVGSAAADANDRIIHDQATGKIYYDPDGTGAAAQVQFAAILKGTILTNADFIIYG